MLLPLVNLLTFIIPSALILNFYEFILIHLKLYSGIATTSYNSSLISLLIILWNSRSFFFFSFILFTLFSGYLFVVKRMYPPLTYSIFILLVLIFNFVNYFNLTNFNLNFGYTYTKANTLLLNNINFIHPPLLYISFSLTLITFLILKVKLNSELKMFLFSISLYLLFSSITSLYLGSWWAAQETNWGGYWNWDPSEVISLSILLFSVLTIHLRNLMLLKLRYYCITLFIFIIILYIYVLTQISFAETSHSFIVINSKLITYYLLFFFYITFIANYVIIIWLKANNPLSVEVRLLWFIFFYILIYYNSLDSFLWNFFSFRLYLYKLSLKVLILLPFLFLLQQLILFKYFNSYFKEANIHLTIYLLLLILVLSGYFAINFKFALPYWDIKVLLLDSYSLLNSIKFSNFFDLQILYKDHTAQSNLFIEQQESNLSNYSFFINYLNFFISIVTSIYFILIYQFSILFNKKISILYYYVTPL